MSNRASYAAKMALRRQNRFSAGLVSEQFPHVSSIVIKMTYYQKGPNPVLMQRTLNILPSSCAYFKMDCMIKGCEEGGFDLTPVIIDMVKDLKKTRKGKMVCHGKTSTNSFDHGSIDYDIVIRYNRA
jgi:hypothetical protein